MGKPQRKKRTHKNIKDFKKKFRTRRKTKDLDEIHDDMIPAKRDELLHQKVDPDLPGEGQFYCLFCARYLISEKTLSDHKRTKYHKKRVRSLKDKPYTQAEAEMAAGMGSYTIKPKAIDNSLLIKAIEKSDISNIDSPASTVTATADVMEELKIDT